MNKFRVLVGFATVLLVGFQAQAQDSARAPGAGQALAGEELFRNCVACHQVVNDAGDQLVAGGRLGPNLYGLIGREAGSLQGYSYSTGLAALNANGHVWTQESLAAFIANPNGFLRAELGAGYTSKMPFAFPAGANDIVAYLYSLDED